MNENKEGLDPIEDEWESRSDSKEHRTKLSPETLNLTDIESKLADLKSLLADGDISNHQRKNASEVIKSIKEALNEIDVSLIHD
jgi:hypothetical protein